MDCGCNEGGEQLATSVGNYTVKKLSPTGTGLGVFANTAPERSLSLIIVPEPSTWALLGLAIPTVLAFRRRKA